MKIIKELSKFPYRNQNYTYDCIPTTIANVMQYHSQRIITPETILTIYTSWTNEEISFDRIKPALENHRIFGNEFQYDIKRKDKDFSDFDNYLNFIEKKIEKSLPLIIVMRLPNTNNHRVHMWTILGIRENKILIYDTDPNKPDEPKWKQISYIKQYNNPKFTTFLITPKGL